MTYSINAVARRVVLSGSAGTGAYSFSFEVISNTDIEVYLDSTKLTLSTDYTVTINSNGTGSVNLNTGTTNVPNAPTSSNTITIIGSRAIARTTDFVTAGDLKASSLNEQLDSLTIFDQQISERVDRSIKGHITDSTTLDMGLPSVANRKGTVLGFHETTGAPQAGPTIADVNSLAAITTNINTVAGISSNVTTVAGISSNVTTVAGISSNVTSVAGNASNINAVVSNASNINTVAGNISNVNAVGAKSSLITSDFVSDLNTVAVTDVINDLNTLATSDFVADLNLAATSDFVSDLNTMATSTNVNNLGTVAGAVSNVNTVAGIASNVSTVAGIASNVTAVAGDATDIGNVSGSIGNVNTVAGSISNVNSVAGNASNINSVAGNSANINSAVSNASNINSAVSNASNINTVAGAITNVNNVGGSIANVNTVATNLSGVNSFAERYRVGSSDPTTSLDEGDLFYNTTSNAYKFYNGSSWNTVNVSGIGSLADDSSPQLGGDLQSNGNDIIFGTNDAAVFGSNTNLRIYNNGSNSIVEEGSGTGDLFLRGTNNVYLQVSTDGSTWENAVLCDADGAVTLRHNNENRVATTGTGADITGVLTADGLDLGAATDAATVSRTASDYQLQLGAADSTTGDIGRNISFDSLGTTTASINTIDDGASSSTNLAFFTGNNSALRNRLEIASGGDIYFYDSTGVTQGFFWDADQQRLGLGTTTPAGLMEVKVASGQSGATQGYRLVTADGGGYALYPTSAIANPTFLHNVNSGESQAFGEGGTAHMTIKSGGSVGIGIASPSNQMHLYGTSPIIRLEDSAAGGQYARINGDGTIGALVLEADSGGGGGSLMNFKVGGTERMRITSAGSVGISTSAPVAQSKLTVAGNSLSVTGADGNFAAGGQRTFMDFAGGKARIGGVGGGGAGTTLGLYVGTGLEAVSVDATGNVGIGTSPATILHVKGADPNITIQDTNDTGDAYIRFKNNSGTQRSFIQTAMTGNVMLFGTGTSERFRLDASGNMLVGTSTAYGQITSLSDGTKFQYASHNTDASGVSQLSFRFMRNNADVGSITTTASGTTYNTTSDIRLKTDIEPLQATDKLMQMNPVSYNWKVDPDGPRSMGFIAQEMQEVMPEAVSGTPDGEDMMSMDYGRITPILVSALQDAHRKIEQLESRLSAMENK